MVCGNNMVECMHHAFLFFYILVERSTDTSTEPLSLAGQYYKDKGSELLKEFCGWT